MDFHLLAYHVNQTGVANGDAGLVNDDVFQERNNHLIVSDHHNVIAAAGLGTNLQRARFGNVSLTQFGPNHIWPVMRSATVVDRPQYQDLRMMPLALPLNEEITVEVTDDAVGATDYWVCLWIAAQQWSMNQPRGQTRLTARSTVTIAAGSESTWTALATPTFERDLKGGVYAVKGANLVAANAVAFRMFFPRQPTTFGRQYRPGALVQDALGNAPQDLAWEGLGEWGRFHTFELPQVQVLGDAAGGTYEFNLNLEYLGESLSLIK